MNPEVEQGIKDQVQAFYDRVGWKEVSEGVYQNARFEDLRPVSSEYIHDCHLRAGQFIARQGDYLLDAGSGPIQYPEYLTYSAEYQNRVCLDISQVALIEARKRLGQKGLYVVADVSALPFCKGAFDGVISLHTLHHLPPQSQRAGYLELLRVLKSGKTAVVVNGWTDAPMMRCLEFLVRWMERIQHRRRQQPHGQASDPVINPREPVPSEPQGTFVEKFTPKRLKEMLGGQVDYEIRCWRSVSVRFLRTMIHPKLAGKQALKLLFWLENWFPHTLGRVGQYPLIILKK